MSSMAGKLLTQRRFLPLFTLLQTGTFNDNALKNAMIALVTFGGILFLEGLPSAIRVPVAGLIFTGPFLLICAIAGQIADKVDRGVILRWVKRAELVIMLIAAFGFFIMNIWVLALALGLMGAQSAFFSPTKNAVLPQWLSDKELITGNALLNGFVFVFLLVGQVGGTLIVLQAGGPRIIAGLLFILALVGWYAAEQCPPAPAPKPDLKINFEPISASWAVLQKAFAAPHVLRPMLGIAWFYGTGTVFVTTLPDFIKSEMQYDQNVLIIILIFSTLSILVGSLVTMLIAKMKIWGPEAVGLSAFGIIGVSLMALGLYLLPHPVFETSDTEALGTLANFLDHQHAPHFLGCLILTSFFNGLFVVPLQAMAQRRSDPAIRAQLMSAGAVILNLFTNAATFVLIALAVTQMPPKVPFLFIAILSAVVGIYASYRRFNPTVLET
ncbi:MAG: MFS transporter [Maricaulaceae bacterium]